MKLSTIAALLLTNASVSLAAPKAGDFFPTLTKRANAITSTSGNNSIATPLPIQPGMVDDCNLFYFVNKGDDCARVSRYYGISFDQFKEWNPSVGDRCLSLWADTNVCVGTIGYVPPTTAACFVNEDIKPWGSERPNALRAIRDWCSKPQNTNRFDVDETKTICYNAPSGTGRFEFEITNEHGRMMKLTAQECVHLLEIPIKGCEEGGQGKTKSWMTMTAFGSGLC